MNRLFAPCVGKKLAPVIINGHRLLIVSQDKKILGEGLNLIGGDRVKSLPRVSSSDEQEKLLGQLAERVSAGIVLAPDNIEMKDLIRSLENELPWVQ